MDTKEYIEFLENQKRYDIPPPNRFNKQIDEIIKQLQESEKWKKTWKEFKKIYGYYLVGVKDERLVGSCKIENFMNKFEEKCFPEEKAQKIVIEIKNKKYEKIIRKHIEEIKNVIPEEIKIFYMQKEKNNNNE